MGANGYLSLISNIKLELLELFGSGYVIEYCVSILLQREEKRKKQEVFYNYIANCLKIITENTAKSVNVGYDASYVSNNLADILCPSNIEEKTGDEIAKDIIKRAGLKISKRGEVTI